MGNTLTKCVPRRAVKRLVRYQNFDGSVRKMITVAKLSEFKRRAMEALAIDPRHDVAILESGTGTPVEDNACFKRLGGDIRLTVLDVSGRQTMVLSADIPGQHVDSPKQYQLLPSNQVFRETSPTTVNNITVTKIQSQQALLGDSNVAVLSGAMRTKFVHPSTL